MSDYLFNSAAWSAGGLIVGYALGRMDQNVTEIKHLLRTHLRNRKDTP